MYGPESLKDKTEAQILVQIASNQIESSLTRCIQVNSMLLLAKSDTFNLGYIRNISCCLLTKMPLTYEINVEYFEFFNLTLPLPS